MARTVVGTITNKDQYDHSLNGTALNILITRGTVGVIARATGFSWHVAYPVTQADEINTTIVKETNHGRQEIGTGSISAVFNLSLNDNLPTNQTIRTDAEYTILEITGDDNPMTLTGKPTILNAFIGVRFVGISSATAVNQTKMLNVEVVFRQRMSGIEYFNLNKATYIYPAT